MHKLMHAGAGAITGAILTPDDMSRGARAGAIGAAAAEMIAEMAGYLNGLYELTKELKQEKAARGESLRREELNEEIKVRARQSGLIGQMGSALVVYCAKQDIAVSIFTANAAIEENYLLHASEIYGPMEELEYQAENDLLVRESLLKMKGYELELLSMPLVAGASFGGVAWEGGKFVARKAFRDCLQNLKQEGGIQPLGRSRPKVMSENMGRPKVTTSRTNPTGARVKEVGSTIGRAGKQKRLKGLAQDDKLGSADRGWLKQEKNLILTKKRTTLRVPPGKELAHKRGFEASKGYDYSYSNLQDKILHRLQHKFDGMGKNAKIK
ncbi:MAG: polymorphic toxin type 8 domain-containing protein [Alphaproteobacteria bacterium]